MQLDRAGSDSSGISNAHWQAGTSMSPQQSPLARISDSADASVRRALDAHFWYPATQRCGCGINLRNSQHWTDHVTEVAVEHSNHRS
jgi:hypothetical protein